jgi:peptidoglycan/xylan/chitin deacetylase (PgdA/CDA1 family)
MERVPSRAMSSPDATPFLTRGRADGGRLYLTFDDGPDPDWTPRVLDLLAAAGLRATFFVVGRAALERAALLRRVAGSGHEVGNHSFSHRHPWAVSPAVARAEVRDGAAAIADLLGQQPRFYRPPHGRLRACTIDEAQRCGETVALWSRSAVDWGPLGRASGIVARLRRVRAGDIVLMHDGRGRINRPDALARALPQFLAEIKSRGLQPALLPALPETAAA